MKRIEILLKTVELLICSSNSELFELWKESEEDRSEYIPEARGLLMDEFSRRDPEGFNEWLQNWNGQPWEYITKQRPAIVQEWIPAT